MAVDVADCKARLARGEQLPGGVCWNPDRKDEFYECSKEEVATAEGKLSVSWDGTKVVDLESGALTERDQPASYKIDRPVTLAETQATPAPAAKPAKNGN